MSDLLDGHTVEWDIISGTGIEHRPITPTTTTQAPAPVASTAAMLRLRDWMMR